MELTLGFILLAKKQKTTNWGHEERLNCVSVTTANKT
jgi:hypothetical protein